MTRNWTKELSIIAIILSISAIIIFIMAKTAPKNDEAQYRDLVKQYYQNFAAPIPKRKIFGREEAQLIC